ncbi:MAG: sigma 54 modulation/S30EA ribosomal C-terminal domain-containing protein [Mycobacterium sp.]|uniref:sigma 54 modulation/S30EA ribosomal C-terminal domain-containing protein n=1 Tax=Mycobacterium sp. TaxID=1785 RepID=UPI00260FE2FA|nr:sigma 54 modulation/S30EA ribosomal C-terminal domain-containing protein [Mycobacterium sp.]MDI3315316.1 sigma 54 modulation/S30EA ribosomal C-terminal domain-containing protein [Mycobacterium sp.]
MSAVEPSAAQYFPDVAVFSDGRISAAEAQHVAHAVGRVLEHRGISGGARVRLTTADRADGPMLVQVNLRVRDTPARVQALTAGPDDLSPALVRLDRQIVRVWGPWRPRPWPDRTRRILTASADALVTRRKAFVLQRETPLQALAVMDAMDYDAHLFTDVESGEEAVVYRAGPSGLRLARQRRMYPPGWSWSPAACNPPVPLIVNSSPTPALSETAAVERVRDGLRFLFFTDPQTGRGRLLYPRYDGNLGLITPVDDADTVGDTGENAAK